MKILNSPLILFPSPSLPEELQQLLLLLLSLLLLLLLMLLLLSLFFVRPKIVDFVSKEKEEKCWTILSWLTLFSKHHLNPFQLRKQDIWRRLLLPLLLHAKGKKGFLIFRARTGLYFPGFESLKIPSSLFLYWKLSYNMSFICPVLQSDLHLGLSNNQALLQYLILFEIYSSWWYHSSSSVCSCLGKQEGISYYLIFLLFC